MKEEIKVLELDKYEYGILINALNELRNKLIKEGRDTEYVDEILLRAIDAPSKKKVLTRSMRKDEHRF
jgi:hypothetical protein